MAAPHGKNAHNQDAAYPSYDQMPAGPPPYGQYPHPAGPPPQASHYPHQPPPSAIQVQPAAVYQTSLGTTTVMPGAVIIQQNVGPHPMRTTCRSCNQEMVTRIDRRPTVRTHLMAGLLCLIGCWPCVCIPYCTDSCLSTDHYCPHCGSFVGSSYAL